MRLAILVSILVGIATAVRTAAAEAPVPSPPTPVASSHALFAPTALTVPRGHAELTVQALPPFAGLVTASVGVSRTTELWLEVAKRFDDRGALGDQEIGVGIKQQVLVQARGAVALTAAIRRYQENHQYTHSFGSFGIVGTLCVDEACVVMLSGAAHLLPGYKDVVRFDRELTERYEGGVTLLTASASVGNAHVRGFLDVAELTNQRDQIVAAGARVMIRSRVAIDAGVVHGFWVYADNDPTCLWLGLTGRL